MTEEQPGYQPPGSGGYGAMPPYGPYAGYGPGGYGPDPQVKSRAMVAFIVSAIVTALCCGALALPGLILGGVALSRTDSDPESARNLTKWAWIALGIGVGVEILFFVLVIVLGVSGALDENNP